jgi:2,3-bisphosphoglycerate-dependent phosphoglycerate mutase
LKTTIWLVRHGETDWNAQRRLQGSTDIALNAVGIAQADSVARWLGHIVFDAIYSSPLSRTVQTAQPLAIQQKISPQLIPAIAERDFGIFQGLTPDDISVRYPDDYHRWQGRDPSFCPQGGESLMDFRGRVHSGIQAIVSEHPGQTVAVFSHGGVLDMIYRLANQLALHTPREWPIPNAGIQRLLGSKIKLEIQDWGITEHLTGPTFHDELRGIA